MRLFIGQALVTATGYDSSLECNLLPSAFEHIFNEALFHCWMIKSTNDTISFDFSTPLNIPRRTIKKVSNDRTPAAYIIIIPHPPRRGIKNNGGRTG